MGEKMNVGELSYCQLMERMLRAEQRVAELEEQLRREQDVDMERMEERGAA